MPSRTRSSVRLRLLRLVGTLASRRGTPLGGGAGRVPNASNDSVPGAMPPRRVLLVRPDHVGDVLLTAPAVALLRASLPDAEITYLVGPWAREVAQHGSRVDHLCALAFPGFTRRRAASLVAPYVLLVREALSLRRRRFDLAIVFRPDHWWGALLCVVAGIPVRIGAATPETEPLLTHAVTLEPDAHAAEHAGALAQLALDLFRQQVSHSGVEPTFVVGEAARVEAGAVWTRHGLDGRRAVAVQPSAGAGLKSWPVQSWAAVADGLIEDGNAVVLSGAPGDAALLTRVAERMQHEPAAVLCGQSLEVSAAMFERCALLVGLDGGAAHLAAAAGTPTVRLYGPASVERYGPWPPGATDQHVLVARTLACVPCGNLDSPPCGAHRLPACLLAIGADDVLTRARRQLRRS